MQYENLKKIDEVNIGGYTLRSTENVVMALQEKIKFLAQVS